MATSTKRPAEVLTSEEVKALVDACSHRYTSGIRLAAMIGVMYGCGLRLAELLALAPKDIDLRKRELLVRHGKGDKPRRLGMPAETVLLVERWMTRRRAYAIPAGAPVFCTYSSGNVGEPLHQQQVRMALMRLRRKAGIEKRVHPHGFRHSFAFELAQEGVPMHVIKDALGHTSLAVTDIYISHLGTKQVLDQMRDRQW